MYVNPNHKEIRTLMARKGLNTYDVANLTRERQGGTSP